MKQPPSPAFTPPSSRARRLFGASSLLALLLSPSAAHAQADIAPPPPNVLLLVDTSGSMDYKTSSNSFPVCKYNGTTSTAQTSERSRWIDLVEVLTGSITNYDCQKLDRTSSGFRNEYTLNTVNPYDSLYPNPYNRPASNGCVPGPGALDTSNPALFPAGAIKYHPYNNTAGTCTFNQGNDGILDAFESDVRFGLMTFDTDPSPATDVNGLWSYFLGSSVTGKPAGCNTDQAQEVGSRNASAPPWEGRAVGFGNPALGSVDFKSRNAMIQQVMLATRPYGATPIAGMLADASAYMLNDTSNDPLDASFRFGPLGEPAKDCRRQSVILLSDGQPNMDLRDFCEKAGGVCPYEKPEDIAQKLKAAKIEVYVIGFALPKITVNSAQISCKDLTSTDLDVTQNGICKNNPNDTAIQACCSLNRIAAAGGHVSTSKDDPDWTRARFADNRAELRKALSDAIGGNFVSTTRTPFVNAAGSGFVAPGANLSFARAFRFGSSFKPGKLDKPWVGELNRSRYVCSDTSGTLKPVLQPPDQSKGDRFVDNVNKGGPSSRTLYSVIGDTPINSEGSIRPNVPTGVNDGVGTYKGTQTKYSGSNLTSIPPDALKVTATTCDTSTVDLDANQCRDQYVKWLTGTNNTTDTYHRCPASDNCNLVAEIYHSIPRAVTGRPSQFLVDSSYQKFVAEQILAKRPPVLYASTNDGFLHAFKMAAATSDSSEAMKVESFENNELWAFLPPGVLTGIPTMYPGTHQLLLDGTPAVREVVATDDASGVNYKFKLERNLSDARLGAGKWRTILVQSYGAKRSGYFAIDVTDPVPSDTKGPKFLWQLNNDAAGNPLFGTGGGTPLITTVYLAGKETAVAILPGGYGTAPSSSACDRKDQAFANFADLAAYKPRTKIPCYSGRAIQARSLTVVRLDDGTILRTFRQAETEVPGLVGKQVTTVSPLDSPMTGQPVAFPADVGSVADRVFIGDQDGTLWRLNFASQLNSTAGRADGNPADWTMELFFDGFPSPAGFGHTSHQGQPIVTAPIISVNDKGNLTIAFSTGEQEAIGAASGLANYVWSLNEKPSSDRKKLLPDVYWNLGLKNALSGDRVVGEMALFSGDLYFTTVGPGTNVNACSSGSGKLWGMHYINAKGSITAGDGGKTATSLGTLVGSNGYVEATTLLGGGGQAYLSGVSVGQQPTCDKPEAANDDDFFSYGVTQTRGAVTPGKYQLIIPTGDRTSTSTASGITPITQGGVNAVAVDLKSPAVMNYVDSWAAIVE